MILENKYIIGTMVMFYELEAVKEFVQSVKNACLTVDNKENIATEFLLNTSEYSEKIDTNYTKEYLHDLFHSYCVKPLEEIGIKVILRYNDDATKLYSVGDYRRDLNYFHCKDYDFITWGEADCLMPKEYFEVIESVSNYANSSNIISCASSIYIISISAGIVVTYGSLLLCMRVRFKRFVNV